MPLYSPKIYRLIELRRGGPPRLLAGVARLINEQIKEEGRRTNKGLPARLRELTRPGSGAHLHALLGQGGRVVGYQFSITCPSLASDYLYINETYIEKKLHGLGLGYELMLRYVEWARTRGVTSICSRTTNPQMRRIVEKLGARVKPTAWLEIPLRPADRRD